VNLSHLKPKALTLTAKYIRDMFNPWPHREDPPIELWRGRVLQLLAEEAATFLISPRLQPGHSISHYAVVAVSIPVVESPLLESLALASLVVPVPLPDSVPKPSSLEVRPAVSPVADSSVSPAIVADPWVAVPAVGPGPSVSGGGEVSVSPEAGCVP